jgi:hypothetical protein
MPMTVLRVALLLGAALFTIASRITRQRVM